MEETRKKMKGKVVFKHETEADWLKSSYIPDEGEMVLYDEDDNYDYKRTKYGNGKDKVKDLPFSVSINLLESGEGENSIQQQGTGAKAYGDRSVAFNQAVAGAKGYRYCAIDTTSKRIYLTANDISNNDIVVIDATDGGTTNQTITPDTSIDITKHYAKNDKFTLKMRAYDLDNAGIIKEIYSNYIVYDDTFAQALEATRLAASQKSTPKTLTQELTTADSYIDRYSFSVPKKPSNGVLIVSEDAFAVGTDGTSAVGRYSFTAGRGNIVVGDTGTAFGRGNTAGYQAFCAGENSIAAERNYSFGYKAKNYGNFTFLAGTELTALKDAHRSIASGAGHVLSHAHTTAFGYNHSTTAPYQTLLGCATEKDPDILVAVGNAFTRETKLDANGTKVWVADTLSSATGKSRSNAFAVYVDGHCKLGRATLDEDDSLVVANKGYVDTAISSTQSALTGKINEVNTRVANHETYLTNLKLPNITYGYVKNEDGTTTIQTTAIQHTATEAKAKGGNSVALIGGTTTGSTSLAAGPNSEANGQWSFAIGHSAKANSHHCFAIGLGTKTPIATADNPNREQFVVGRYNEVLPGASYSSGADGARFIVGIGTGDATNQRKNGLVVWGDGRVTIGADPSNDMDVVNKRYLSRVTMTPGAGAKSLQAADAKATGTRATAFALATASGTNSIAIGNADTIASASYAFAMGEGAIASEQNAISLGGATMASGRWSVALGHGTKVEMRDQIAVGRFNEVLPGPTAYADTTNGAIFMVGNGVGEAGRSNAFVSWNDGRATIGKAPTQKMDVANKGYVDTSIANLINSAPETLNTLGELASALEAHEDAYDGLLEVVGNKADKDYVDDAVAGIDIPETISEWDYVIDKLEDFTTENLATMSGRVLVKGVKYLVDFDDPWSIPRLNIDVPSSISLIKFIDSRIYAALTAKGNSTRISGFVGDFIDDGMFVFLYSNLYHFNGVEFCSTGIDLSDCSDIIHCKIHQAYRCSNISDVIVDVPGIDGINTVFDSCTLIDTVRFNITASESDGYRTVYEFVNCSHISNVINDYPENAQMNYENCLFVDGDTCDGYYIEEDAGKVQAVSTDGTSAFISVYSQDEIDGKLGDISSILTALHEGGIE